MRYLMDHDLHCHSYLSPCLDDPQQTAENILAHAKQNGYRMVCITDHLWDPAVPGYEKSMYRDLNIDYAKRILPLPEDDQVKMLFGCETEYCGGTKLGLSPAHFDDFDFIVIPPNHFHMKPFVRPTDCDTVEKVAELFVSRLEQLSELDLPWHKVGIAHMNCCLTFSQGDCADVFERMDEQRFRSVMRRFAQRGAGIEINGSCFQPGWREREAAHLRLFRLAKEEGCKFYLGSDAHGLMELPVIPRYTPEVCALLGLQESDKFVLNV